jgi:2-hydroxy-3-oxopropionate reductase
MTEAKAAIGFVGTGIMGARMARRLIEAGYALTVWNRTPEKTRPLADLGAKVALSLADVGAGNDMVISMLADGPSVEEVLFEGGIAKAMPKGSLFVDMSSIPPPTARAHFASLAELGIGHIDAPVSGGPTGAQSGTLAIMAGGSPVDFARAQPVLSHLGRPTLVGPAGSGQLAKLCNQIIVAVTIGAVSEALLLADQGGADPNKVREALKGGFADSLILQLHGQRMIERRFAPGGPCRLQLKDLRTILAAAGECGLHLPLSSHVADLYRALVERGGGEYDHSALILEIEKMNALKRLGDKPDSFTN